MDILNDLTIDKLQVIGQSADKSIIFCYHRERRRIICFDQHAAHERIKYENLVKIAGQTQSLDYLRSRACHGAIRAGCKLDLIQCHTLVENLLKCKLPYRCAHKHNIVRVLDSLDEILYLEKSRPPEGT